MNDSKTKELQDTPLPKLRHDLSIYPCQETGGEKKWRLHDPVSDRYFHIQEKDHQLLQALAVSATQQACLKLLLERGRTCSVAELSEMIRFLQRNHLFQALNEHQVELLDKEQEVQRRGGGLLGKLVGSYVYLKLPVVRPDRFLSEVYPLLNTYAVRLLLVLLAGLSCWGFLELLPNWHRLADSFRLSLTWHGGLSYLVALIAVKVIHELGHAFAAKANGVRVREMGVALIIFLPRLYTDLTDTWQVASRYGRMLIDAAGILCEMVLAGIMILVWARTSIGTAANSAAYYLFSVSLINTILFNGNPLMRFDGYYLLCDWLDVENLQARSIGLVKSWVRRILFGLRAGPAQDSGWFAIYGVMAAGYRLLIYSSIIGIVYYKFTRELGAAMAVGAGYTFLVRPSWQEVRSAWGAGGGKSIVRACLIIGCILMVALMIPIRQTTVLQAHVEPVERQVLHISTPGLVTGGVRDEGEVKAGDRLCLLKNTFLDRERAILELEEEQLKEEMSQAEAVSADLAASKLKAKRLESVEISLREVKRKQSLLKYKATMDGTLFWYVPPENRWYAKGEVLGEVFEPKHMTVMARAREEQIGNLKKGDAVVFYRPDDLRAYPGKVESLQMQPDDDRKDEKKAPTGETFRVSVVLNEPVPDAFFAGRTGFVAIQRTSTLGARVYRSVLGFLRKDFPFQ